MHGEARYRDLCDVEGVYFNQAQVCVSGKIQETRCLVIFSLHSAELLHHLLAPLVLLPPHHQELGRDLSVLMVALFADRVQQERSLADSTTPLSTKDRGRMHDGITVLDAMAAGGIRGLR